jgi:hypothetical protein
MLKLENSVASYDDRFSFKMIATDELGELVVCVGRTEDFFYRPGRYFLMYGTCCDRKYHTCAGFTRRVNNVPLLNPRRTFR